MSARTDFRTFVLTFWRTRVNAREDVVCEIAPAVAAVLADPAITRGAVEYAVIRLRNEDLDRHLRTAFTGIGATKIAGSAVHTKPTGQLMDALIEHGMTILEVRFGAHRLGDYLPGSLRTYGEGLIGRGKTEIVRGRLAIAIANQCGDETQPVRAQLSEPTVQRICAYIKSQVPEKQYYKKAFGDDDHPIS